jgi:hypothetical protein
MSQVPCSKERYLYCPMSKTVYSQWQYPLVSSSLNSKKMTDEVSSQDRIVEAAHSWINRFRRLLVRWEKKAPNYLLLFFFACAIICWRKCEL